MSIQAQASVSSTFFPPLLSRTIRKFKNHSKLKKLNQIYDQFNSYTMVSREKYLQNLLLVERFQALQGVVVECGVWKGGMIAGIAKFLGQKRTYYLFDSFEGLPPAQKIDGDRALQWQKDTTAPSFYDNCSAPIEFAQQAMNLSMATQVQIIKGWFQDTLKESRFNKNIAFLRLDGDWYDSTMTALESLFPHVVPGGIIIIDDYCDWEGCTKAVHDFLSKNQLKSTIRQFNNQVTYIRK